MNLEQLMQLVYEGRVSERNTALKVYQCGAPDDVALSAPWGRPEPVSQLIINNIGGLPCEGSPSVPGEWCDRCPWRIVDEISLSFDDDDIPF